MAEINMSGGNFDIAEVRTDSAKRKRLRELAKLRKQTEKRADLTEETRTAKLKTIDREIADIKSDSRHR